MNKSQILNLVYKKINKYILGIDDVEDNEINTLPVKNESNEKRLSDKNMN